MVLYQHDGPASFRLQVIGDLQFDDVHNMEQAWRTASSITGGKNLIVDLRGLDSADQEGMVLIERLRDAGACFAVGHRDAPLAIAQILGLSNEVDGGNEPARGSKTCGGAFFGFLRSLHASR